MHTTLFLLFSASLCVSAVALDAERPVARCMCTVDATDSAAWLAFQQRQLREVDAVKLVRIEGVAWEDTIEVATASVLRHWKGAEAPTIRIATGATRNPQVLTIRTCALRFRSGDEYLLLAVRRPDGLYRTNLCSGTVSRADAGPLLAVLDGRDPPV